MLIRFADKDIQPQANERLGFMKSFVLCLTKEAPLRRVFDSVLFSFFCVFGVLYRQDFLQQRTALLLKFRKIIRLRFFLREQREEILSFISRSLRIFL